MSGSSTVSAIHAAQKCFEVIQLFSLARTGNQIKPCIVLAGRSFKFFPFSVSDIEVIRVDFEGVGENSCSADYMVEFSYTPRPRMVNQFLFRTIAQRERTLVMHAIFVHQTFHEFLEVFWPFLQRIDG